MRAVAGLKALIWLSLGLVTGDAPGTNAAAHRTALYMTKHSLTAVPWNPSWHLNDEGRAVWYARTEVYSIAQDAQYAYDWAGGGLRVYYALDEGSGTSTVDLMALQADAVLVGGVVWTSTENPPPERGWHPLSLRPSPPPPRTSLPGPVVRTVDEPPRVCTATERRAPTLIWILCS